MDANAGKTCGDCSLCCKVMEIDELHKPKGVWCDHFARGKGCTIYDKRPRDCQTFKCQWLINDQLGPEWKPNKCGLVMVGEGPAKFVVYVDAGSSGAAWREPHLTWLRRIAAQRLDLGAMVLVIEKGQTTLVLPDRSVELGIVGDDDQIILKEVRGEGARNWEATVMKKAAAERFMARVAKGHGEN